MKKYLAFLLIVFGLALVYFYYVRGLEVRPVIEPSKEIEQGQIKKSYQWSIKSPLPTPRTEVTGAILNGHIYVIGGIGSFSSTLDTVEAYDPATDSWSKAPSLPGGRHHAVAVTLGNKIYVFGGYTGIAFTPKSEVFVFDGEKQQWSKATSLPEPRGAMAAAVIDGKIYVVGGVGPSGLANDLFVYDPANDSWQKRAPAPTKRDHLAAGAMNGLLYVAGGREESLAKNFATLEIYDPATDTWTTGSAMPTARGGVAGAVFDEMLVVVGGESATKTFNEVEAYDSKTNQWHILPKLPTPRHGLTAVTLGQKLYVIGGGPRPGFSVSGSNEVLEVIYQTSQNEPEIKTIKIGKVELEAEFAVTREQKIQGLSGREFLPDNRGMLFVFERPDFYTFWMKDMRFAIDIMWIDENKQVVDIAHNVTPQSYPEIFKPQKPAQYVLEVNTGFAEHNNINKGDKVEF